MGRILGGTCAALLLGVAMTATAHASTSSFDAYQGNERHDGVVESADLTLPLAQRWSLDLGGPVSYPLMANGLVFVTVDLPGNTDTLQARNQATGAVAWTAALGFASRGLAYAAGRVFVAGTAGDITAFSAATGAVDWHRVLPDGGGDSSPVAARDRVFLSAGGHLVALRQSDGATLWRAPGAAGGSSPALHVNQMGVTDSCGSTRGYWIGLGDLGWVAPATGCSGAGARTPVMAGHLWTQDRSAGAHPLIGLSDGSPQGTFLADAAPAATESESYVVHGGTLQKVTYQAPLTPQWTFPADGHLVTAPLLIDGRVYAGSSAGSLQTVRTDGTDGQSTAAPAFDAAETTVPTSGLSAANGTIVGAGGSHLTAWTSAGTISQAPVNRSAPFFTGSRAGSTLAADAGLWSRRPTSYAFRWQTCGDAAASCVDVPGATSSRLTIADDAVNSRYRIVVTATNAAGSATAAGDISYRMQPALEKPAATQLPEVVGYPEVGEVLSVLAGDWSRQPDAFLYQWYRCTSSGNCADIADAITPGYQPVDADRGFGIGVRVIAANADHSSEPVESDAVGPVTGKVPHVVTGPEISGLPQVGATLTVSAGTWTAAPTGFSYTWLSCSDEDDVPCDVRSSTTNTYTVQDGDLSRLLLVGVTASNAEGEGETGVAGAGPIKPASAAPTAPIVTRPTLTNPLTVQQVVRLPQQLPRPSSKFSSSGKRMTKTGKVYFDETTASPGTFTIRALAVPRNGGKPFESGHLSRKVSTGLSHFALKLNDKGAKLFKRGKLAKIRLEVSFLPDRGTTPRVQTLTYEIKRKR